MIAIVVGWITFGLSALALAFSHVMIALDMRDVRRELVARKITERSA